MSETAAKPAVPQNKPAPAESKPATPSMSDADIAEYNRLRAEDEARKRAEEEAAKHPPLTLAEKMKEDYIQNRGTIQTIARHYKVEVDDVLRAIGQGEMAQVSTIGDLVDSAELGPDSKEPPKAEGTPAVIPYSLN